MVKRIARTVTKVILCKECGEDFTWTKPVPVRGRWPKYHKECTDARTKRSKREHIGKVRLGESTYRPVAPYWDRTHHEGPGSRPRIRRIDYWEDFPAPMPSVKYKKKGPVSSGDPYEDALRKAILLQDSDWLWRTSRGPDEGETVLGLPKVQLDEESKQWLLENPGWWRDV